MTQSDSVQLWLSGAKEALISAEKLFEFKRYDHCLFMIHLALEKLLKAVFIKTQDDAPPYTHSLSLLVEKSGFEITDQEKKELDEISEFNVSGRYEEYKTKIYVRATSEYATIWFKKAKNCFDLYLSKL